MDAPAQADRKRARRIGMLLRRAAHLEARIAASPDRKLTYDQAEASALRWAVRELEKQHPRREESGPCPT